MFAYLRYFSAISALIITLGAFIIGVYIRTIAENDLKTLVEKNNAALIQGFENTVWRNNRAIFDRLNLVNVADWKKYREFVAFSESTYKYFETMPVARVNIYTRDGARILSIDPFSGKKSDIITFTDRGRIVSLGRGNDAEKASFRAAIDGKTSSNILKEKVSTLEGGATEGVLVQTFLPIISEQYVPVLAGSNVKTEAVVEVLFDVTSQWNKLNRFQMIATGIIIAIFALLILVLILTSRKAEAIISKQHEANIELSTAAATAEAENREKSLFLANISHELRTPLNAIIGFSEIMKNELMGKFPDPRYQDYVRDIHYSGVHLLSLINDILDYSKAEVGKLELELSEVDATKTIMNSMRLVTPRAKTAGVRLVSQLPGDHFVLYTDAKKLKQIMLNLLSNAVKFTPQGGEIKVTAWGDLKNNSVFVEVKDTGIGIAPKDISRAMAPFGQVDNSLSRKYDGTGLGLPLTRKFVEIMGGEFAIKSEVNVGTTVTVRLPLRTSEQSLGAKNDTVGELK